MKRIYHIYRLFFATIGLIVTLGLAIELSGQSTYALQLHEASNPQKLKYEREYSDTILFSTAINEALIELREDGQLLANLDSLSYGNDKIVGHLFVGGRYNFGNISISEENLQIVRAAGLRKYNWSKAKVEQSQIGNYMTTIVRYLEDHGYPFASVGLESVTIEDQKVNGFVVVDRGQLVTFDSLKIEGTLDIRKGFLYQYLDIKVGEPYSRVKFELVEKRLKELPFLKVKASPRLRFYDGMAEVYIQADKQRSNRFDFLIGVLPSTENGEQRFNITGEFTGELYNRLGSGEYLYASIERLRPDISELDLKFTYPYIGGLPIGVATGLKVYRKSCDFIEVIADLGMSYKLSGFQELQFGWNYKSSRLIEIDSSILKTGKLPNDLDITYQGGKLGYSYERLDYRWNPSSGLRATFSGTVGQKTIIPNKAIQGLKNSEFDFANSYDNLKLKSFQLEAVADISYFLPLAKIITLKMGLNGAMLYNTESVFENEFYRIGGNRNLRGFDEQTVRTQAYGISSTELRLILDRNSYLTLPFFDFGYTQIVDNEQLIWDQVFGVGLGINFATPAGIFNVSFATGSRLNIPADFSNTKVHFGYVSLF